MSMYLGIDIGGTKILAVAVRTDGAILAEVLEGTPRGVEGIERELSAIVRDFSARHRIAGIGVGVPGPVDAARGILLRAPHLPFLDGWRVRAFLKKRSRLPVAVGNDSQCFLRAEMRWGAGRGYREAAAFTFGTGIGGALAVAGAVHPGAHHAAGEFGHMLMAGTRGLESLAGRKSAASKAARSAAIGKGVANIVNILDPGIVILGGGALAEGLIDLPTVRKNARPFILSPLARRTPIVEGRLGEPAQAMGAALLAADPS